MPLECLDEKVAMPRRGRSPPQRGCDDERVRELPQRTRHLSSTMFRDSSNYGANYGIVSLDRDIFRFVLSSRDALHARDASL